MNKQQFNEELKVLYKYIIKKEMNINEFNSTIKNLIKFHGGKY